MSEAPSPERRAVAAMLLGFAGAFGGAAVGDAIAAALDGAAVWGAIGCAVAIPVCLAQTRRCAAVLPRELDGAFACTRWRAWLWCALAALAVANVARIGVFVVDMTTPLGAVIPVFEDRHACFDAYYDAAKLAAEGHADLWNRRDYVADPYEYPPFLAAVLRAAMWITARESILRALWFGLSGLALIGAYVSVARSYAPRSLWLFPVVMLTVPVLGALDWGQAHILVIACAIAGMVRLERGRRWSGSALLAVAIAIKVFPVLLAVHLIARRRWRDLGAVAAWSCVLVAATAAVLGTDTIVEFASQQLGKLATGDAFWRSISNQSPYGLGTKLGALWPDLDDRLISKILHGAWIAISIALAWRARGEPAVVWLGIISCAALCSPFTPIYAGASILWLLAIAPRYRSRVIAIVAWLALQGLLPESESTIGVLISLPLAIASIAVPIYALTSRATRARTDSPASLARTPPA